MTYLYPLFSGSSGNCTLVSSKGGTVLVDAGVSCKAIVGALTELSFSPEALNGILITHEHSDHIKGLSVFTKRYKLPIYSSREVLDYLVRHSCVHPDCSLFEIASPMTAYIVWAFALRQRTVIPSGLPPTWAPSPTR